jgi:hypothetical protein
LGDISLAQARFDLARLALAERVAALEGGAPVAAARDLAPKYLSTTPADPFTSGAFARTAGGVFYSVGPDRQDGQGAPVYDPTNGTLSTGDILLSRK